MASISYDGNKAIDYKLNVFAQLELEKLDNIGNKIKLESLNEQTDGLSKLLYVNHGVFVRNKKMDIPDSEIPDIRLMKLLDKVKSRNGEMYFDGIDELKKPLNISRFHKQSGEVVIRIEFSNDPATVSFLHQLNSDGLLGETDRKNLPEIDSITPSFFVSNRDAVRESVSNGSNQIDIAKMICRDFVEQKPQYLDMYAKQKLKKRTPSLDMAM
ncbi:hypothetical protein NDJ00_13420 [Vibrio parahaemolyticus]|uniref:hypothetical protein n=1 Tax=Vibrio parahaemolyticus TaxID=670 RepID=UPI001A2EE02B|nr:hypothetical protein [Vibrio parahaemolyticus]EJG0764898.1 hypothetical protein [Vibrio parahaemolyticus O5:K30]MCS0115174.1 hypothetical protein [Vibrio parahaemolyticus]